MCVIRIFNVRIIDCLQLLICAGIHYTIDCFKVNVNMRLPPPLCSHLLNPYTKIISADKVFPGIVWLKLTTAIVKCS